MFSISSTGCSRSNQEAVIGAEICGAKGHQKISVRKDRGRKKLPAFSLDVNILESIKSSQIGSIADIAYP